jgi:hypothetical protein
MVRRSIVSLTIGIFLLTSTALAGSSLAVHFLGLYDSPTRPVETVRFLTDGFGFQLVPEIQFNRFLGLGLGFTSDYLYRPGGPALRVGTFDFSVRLRKPTQGTRPQPYVHAGLGLNILSKTGNHWRGSGKVSLGIGTRLPVGFGLGLDFAIRQVFLLPKPNNLQYVSVQWGIVTEFDLKKRQRDAQPPRPTATPTATTAIVINTSANMIPTATSTLKHDLTQTPTPGSTHRLTQPLMTFTQTQVVRISNTPTMVPQIPTPTQEAAVRMRDLYDQGISAYKAKRYDRAIDYLKKALLIKDSKVEYWYYAEANAMLGVIYHYHRLVPGHKEKARGYYRAALKVDPATVTAKKGLKLLGTSPGN